jgi:hypothetical protein
MNTPESALSWDEIKNFVKMNLDAEDWLGDDRENIEQFIFQDIVVL